MSGSPLILFVAFPVAGYLIGSIPFGYLIGRARGVDLRTRGSGNVGATNVARVAGRKWGYLCFVLDVTKGFVPVMAAGLYLQGLRPAAAALPPPLHQAAWLAAAFGAIAGHVLPFWLKFRGGKGVATSLGVLIGVYPYFTFPGLLALGLWCAIVLIWRYVSLASISAAAAFPVLFVGVCISSGRPVGRLWPLLAFAATMAALIIARHRTNIKRLLAGTEGRIGQGKTHA